MNNVGGGIKESSGTVRDRGRSLFKIRQMSSVFQMRVSCPFSTTTSANGGVHPTTRSSACSRSLPYLEPATSASLCRRRSVFSIRWKTARGSEKTRAAGHPALQVYVGKPRPDPGMGVAYRSATYSKGMPWNLAFLRFVPLFQVTANWASILIVPSVCFSPARSR